MNTCSSCLGCDLQVFQTLSQPGTHVIFRTTLRGCESEWCPYFTHEGAEIGRKRGLAQSTQQADGGGKWRFRASVTSPITWLLGVYWPPCRGGGLEDAALEME